MIQSISEQLMQWNAMECNGMQWNAMECNGMQWNAMECNGPAKFGRGSSWFHTISRAKVAKWSKTLVCFLVCFVEAQESDSSDAP